MDEASTAVAFKVCVHLQSRLTLYTEWEERDLRKQVMFVLLKTELVLLKSVRYGDGGVGNCGVRKGYGYSFLNETVISAGKLQA